MSDPAHNEIFQVEKVRTDTRTVTANRIKKSATYFLLHSRCFVLICVLFSCHYFRFSVHIHDYF